MWNWPLWKSLGAPIFIWIENQHRSEVGNCGRVSRPRGWLLKLMPCLRVKWKMFSSNLCWEPIILMYGSRCSQSLDLAVPVIKWVQVRMLMDSLGFLTILSTLVQTVSLSALPLVCLLIQAHQQALCAHKGPSVKLLCANWTATHAHCFPYVLIFVISVMSLHVHNH